MNQVATLPSDGGKRATVQATLLTDGPWSINWSSWIQTGEGFMAQSVRVAKCTCGQVVCEAYGHPILTAVCYCDDCQAGGHLIEALPHAAPILDKDGGTTYLTYRDDRWRCIEGKELLRDYKVRPGTSTRRFVAMCCNSGMYLKYEPGFWVSTYRNRYLDEVPPIQFRNQTRYRKSNEPMPDSAPAFRRFPMRLFAKLLAARWAMLLGR